MAAPSCLKVFSSIIFLKLFLKIFVKILETDCHSYSFVFHGIPQVVSAVLVSDGVSQGFLSDSPGEA